ncbi:transcriptional regulator [Vibrio parahaemolyticus]|nr:transcriptional regulator [Vibrio parahaemolyticus]
MPLSYFFCEDVDSAELVCLIDKLNEADKKNLIDHIKKKLDGIE